MTAIEKERKDWRSLLVLGLTMMLTGCVTAAHPPCSTSQRLARLRQEQVLRSSINKRRRNLVAMERRATALACQNPPKTRYTSQACQILMRSGQPAAAQIRREEVQLQDLLKKDRAEQSLFGQQTSCVAASQKIPVSSVVKHPGKHSHHKPHPSPRSLAHLKANAPFEGEGRHDELPVVPAPLTSEAPGTTSFINTETGSIPVQPSIPTIAPQPAEHDYVADPHMRVIGRSFFQDDIKLQHEGTP